MIKSFINTITVVFIFSLFFSCEVEKIKYKGIDRTLNLLQQSSELSRTSIDILFYGQSIIGGMKTDILIDSLKHYYPYAQINYKHKPIGGFTIPKLIKTAEHDLYHENPDLIIFHAYGGIKEGVYDSLIQNIRSRMSSDVLLLDHHYVWNKPNEKLKAINEVQDIDSKEIKKISEKYDCGLVEVRKEWEDYLINNDVKPNELIGNTVDPDVHPNEFGNTLLRSIVLSKLKEQPNSVYSIKADSLRTYFKINSKNDVSSSVIGNRFELVTNTEHNDNAKIEVFIDNKRPSEHKSNFYITRPSKAYKNWMPSILKISLGEPLPRKENWILQVTDIDRKSSKFSFMLKGSVTGLDGKGHSDSDFISNSGRIKINKEDFFILETDKIFNNQTPANFKVTFSINQIVEDTILLNSKKERYTLFRAFKNGEYDIDLNIISGQPILKSISWYSPFLY